MEIPRYSSRSLPPYAYVPGQTPHPVSNPQGHAYGEASAAPTPLDPTCWRECEDYLHAIDLFNHGFPWEAHEAWERLWISAGRSGSVADFVKALIKLAAAEVKALEGRPEGALRHRRRAAELLRGVAASNYAGLSMNDLLAMAEQLADEPARVLRPE